MRRVMRYCCGVRPNCRRKSRLKYPGENPQARARVPEEADPRHSVRCLWLLPSGSDQVRNIPLGGSPPGTATRVWEKGVR